MADKTYYVAHLKIEKLVKTAAPRTDSRAPREITETTNLTLKSETFERLKEKIAAHVGFMDEEDL